MVAHPAYPLLVGEHRKLCLAPKQFAPFADVCEARSFQTRLQCQVTFVNRYGGHDEFIPVATRDALGQSLLTK